MEKSVFTPEYDILRVLLRDVRQRQNLTQGEVAARLSETQSFVSKCERGERRLDLVQLDAFCTVLGVELVEFVKEYSSRVHRKQAGRQSRRVPKTKETRS